jgi:hypothetical protein
MGVTMDHSDTRNLARLIKSSSCVFPGYDNYMNLRKLLLFTERNDWL